MHHAIEENAEIVLDMLFKKEAKIIVVGGAKTLPNSMELSLTRILTRQGVNEKEAKTVFQDLKQRRRIVFENW